MAKATAKLATTLRADIIKPLGISWDEAGEQLRAIQRVGFRVLNRAIATLVFEGQQGKLGATKDGLTPAQTRAYQLVREALESEGAAATVGSRVVLGWAGAVYERYIDWRKHGWAKSLPSWTGTAPICVPSSGAPWSIRRVDGNWILSVKLHPGKAPRLQLVVAPDRGTERQLRRLLEDAKQGDLKILPRVPGSRTRKRWSTRMAFTSSAPPPAGGDSVIALHRGIRRMLTAVCTDGHADVLADGSDVLAFKRQMAARKGAYRKQLTSVGRGARGHGWRRRTATYRKLADYEARWVETRCKQLAASVVKLAQKRDAHMVILEDWTTTQNSDDDLPAVVRRLIYRWPFAMERALIEHACKRAGIAVATVKAAYHSQRCPSCGSTDMAQVDRGKHSFTCLACMYYGRDLDVTAAFNMLIDAGHAGAVKEILSRQKRLLAGMLPMPKGEGSGGDKSPGTARQGADDSQALVPARKSSPGPVSSATDQGSDSPGGLRLRQGARKASTKLPKPKAKNRPSSKSEASR